MFKYGDKIVYLKDKLDIIGHDNYYRQYQLKDLYDIKTYYIFDSYNSVSNNRIIYLKDYKSTMYAFNADDFISLKEYRKRKIEKLCSK